MILFNLFSENPILIIPWLAALLMAITVHEFAHGLAAYKLGDKTAYHSGRLTLNPIDHIDPFGAIMLLVVGFGWAKPVPIDINQIKKGNFGLLIVSMAGVFLNLVFATIILLVLKFFVYGVLSDNNIMVIFFGFVVYINLALFAFNLLPIPPLDGFHVIEYFFPSLYAKYAPIAQTYGSIILLIVVFGTPIVGTVISYFVYWMSLLFQIPILDLAFGQL